MIYIFSLVLIEKFPYLSHIKPYWKNRINLTSFDSYSYVVAPPGVRLIPQRLSKCSL